MWDELIKPPIYSPGSSKGYCSLDVPAHGTVKLLKLYYISIMCGSVVVVGTDLYPVVQQPLVLNQINDLTQFYYSLVLFLF